MKRIEKLIRSAKEVRKAEDKLKLQMQIDNAFSKLTQEELYQIVYDDLPDEQIRKMFTAIGERDIYEILFEGKENN